MTPLSVFLALSMILGPFVWALLRCAANADRRYDRMVDSDRERVRRALQTSAPAGLGLETSRGRSVPNLSQRIPPLVNDERTPSTWVVGSTPEVVHGHASTSGPLRRPIVNGSGIVR